MQHPMVVREAMFHGQPHDPQGGRHGARTGSQARAQSQRLRMAPHPARKAWRKGCQPQYDRVWQGWHDLSSVDRMSFGSVQLS
jgi:hypothetical protein